MHLFGGGCCAEVVENVKVQTMTNVSSSTMEALVSFLGGEFGVPPSNSAQKYPILLWEK